MNAKKEREVFAAALKRHVKKESRIVEEYRVLSELLEHVPAASLVDWIIAEAEAHQNLLCTVMNALRQAPQIDNGNGTDGVGTEEEKILYWTERLRLYEQKFAADCIYLKSQACWEGGDIFDAVFDAMIMDSKKHRRLLLALEKMAKR